MSDDDDVPLWRKEPGAAAQAALDVDMPDWLLECEAKHQDKSRSPSMSTSSDGLPAAMPAAGKASAAQGKGKGAGGAQPAAKGKAAANSEGAKAAGGKKDGKRDVAPVSAAAEIPLVLPEKLTRNKVIVQCEGHDDTVDFEGDFGAVGRIEGTSAKGGIRLDLKGVIYNGQLVPCSTLMVVKVDKGEAKVETLENCFLELQEEQRADDIDDGFDDGFALGDALAMSESEDTQRKKGKKEDGGKKRKKRDGDDEGEDDIANAIKRKGRGNAPVGKPAKPKKGAAGKAGKGGAKRKAPTAKKK